MSWTFDPPTGTWQNPELSDKLLLTASYGVGITEIPATYRGTEYGRAFQDADSVRTEQRLIETMRAMLDRARIFFVRPHLRRTDASYWQCACGEQLKPPTDYGRTNDRFTEHRDHEKVWTLKLGDAVAVYAISSQPNPDPLVLREGEPTLIEVAA